MSKEFRGGCSSAPQSQKNGNNAQFSNVQNPINMIKVGKKAPDFELPAYHNGEFKNYSLSDFRGKWVLLCFYPGDFTFVWATEVSAVAGRYPELSKLDAIPLSVSVDSVFVHKVWNDNELSKMVDGGIPYPMLSDQAGRVGSIYGVFDEDAGVNNRGRFIIDPDGIVQGYEVLTPPVGRNVDESIRQLKAFKHVRATQGKEALPSGWQEGKKTLKPGIDLVANVWKEWTVKDEK